MKGKNDSLNHKRTQDEKAFFYWVERSLKEKGFQVVETLPRRISSGAGQAELKNF